MSNGVNRVIILGKLGRDPEVRYGKSGGAICNLSVATSRRFKKGEEWVDETEWHRVTVFGKTAELCGQYLSKGREVFLEGRLQTRSWEDKNGGGKRYSTDIIADQVTFVGGKGDGPKQETRGHDQSPKSGEFDTGGSWDQSPGDDDGIPF
jgi:single-strand DNA-binding protein